MSLGEILGFIIALASGTFLYIGFRKTGESNNLSRYVPADTINSIPFEVPVVITGTVTADQPLISPVTKKTCVYYEYILEKETERKDNKGMTSWEWEAVGSPERQAMPFYLQDTSGKILIKPEDCEVTGIYRTQQFLQPGTVLNVKSTGMKILEAALDMTNPVQGNRERVTENTIFTGSALNVFGILTMEGEQKFIQQTQDYPMVLSPLSKDQLVKSERKNAYLFYALAAGLLIIGMIIILGK
jgi:hypothetical protein